MSNTATDSAAEGNPLCHRSLQRQTYSRHKCAPGWERFTTRLDVAKLNMMLSSGSLETGIGSSNLLRSASESFSICNSARDDRNTRLRGRFRNLHMPTDLLPGSTIEEKEALLFKRVRQADVLARFAVRRVLDDPTLTRTFENEATINEFWHQSDGERVKRWGGALGP
jgi:hypothetical protein